MTTQEDFARRLTASLDQGLSQIDAATLRRLASVRRHAVSAEHADTRGHSVLTLLHRHAFVGTFLLLAMLLAGWWLMQSPQRSYTPETDILLLTGDLPPDAYADKTFSQWLDSRATF